MNVCVCVCVCVPSLVKHVSLKVNFERPFAELNMKNSLKTVLNYLLLFQKWTTTFGSGTYSKMKNFSVTLR